MGIFLCYDDMFEHRMHGSSVGIAKIHDGDCYWYGAGWYTYIESTQSWSSFIAEHPGDLMRQIYFWPLEKFIDEVFCDGTHWTADEVRKMTDEFSSRRMSLSFNKILTPEEASCPPPEPSPADRALDDFIARRVAKRSALWHCGECGAGFLPDDDALSEHMATHDAAIDDRQSKALDRAMSQLGPHDTDIHARLMPSRLESKS